MRDGNHSNKLVRKHARRLDNAKPLMNQVQSRNAHRRSTLLSRGAHHRADAPVTSVGNFGLTWNLTTSVSAGVLLPSACGSLPSGSWCMFAGARLQRCHSLARTVGALFPGKFSPTSSEHTTLVTSTAEASELASDLLEFPTESQQLRWRWDAI